MKILWKYLAVGIGVVFLFGCTSYTFGVNKVLNSSGNRKVDLSAGITPKEWPGVGIARKAILEVRVDDYDTGRNLLYYKRVIRVANCDYETRLEGGLLRVVVTDRFDSSRKWILGFAQTANGHFELEHEDGKFERR